MWGAVFPLKVMDQLSSADAPASDVLPRRAVQRRQILVIMALSYCIDALVLSIYALAGTTGITTPPIFLVCAREERWVGVEVPLERGDLSMLVPP